MVLKNLRDLDEKEKIKIYNEALEHTSIIIIKEKLAQLENLDNALENPLIRSHIINYIIKKIDEQK